jgi:hypothetical protein
MPTKSFKDLMIERLTPEEIDKIEKDAKNEVDAYLRVTLVLPNNPNKLAYDVKFPYKFSSESKE